MVEPTRPAPGGARVLVNPAAGHGASRRALPELERLAGAAGIDLIRPGSLEELVAEAARAADDGMERLLVAGGDGTVHQAVQALAERATALAVVPVGSGNDFAATVGMPKELPAAFEAALRGPVRELDLGKIGGRFGERAGDAARWFAGVAGVGFDSEVARTILEGGRRGLGRLFRGSGLYVYGVLRTLGSFRPLYLTLEHDGGTWRGRVMLVAFGNTHRFGGGMRIAPNAVPDDGLLDVVIVKAIHKLTLLRVFPKVYQGTHLSHPAVETFRARRLTVHLDRELVAFGDGEPMTPVGEAGVTVELVPRALRVVAGHPAS